MTTMKELRARMESDAQQVICQAKTVKMKLEELDKANMAHRRLLWCGPWTLAERTRTSIVGGLGSKLKKLIYEFHELEEFPEEFPESHLVMAPSLAECFSPPWSSPFFIPPSLFFLSTLPLVYSLEVEEEGHPSPEFESPPVVLASKVRRRRASSRRCPPKAREGSEKFMKEVVMEVKERNDAVKAMERSLKKLEQVFMDMAVLVGAQGEKIEDIESHVEHANSFAGG
ncbi:syntaxin-124-like [Dioscorea cayenensis subsp. rotundata]|uniref:Syntaxin-124-like n=1 Tax=Dioscorea cayennensis subsp. rotundata TaxID=55577 RepID=A0AB40B145_DIOCR|nr:syntaxin-124-like [Dioscorea cayenensis subsp. rotundata]